MRIQTAIYFEHIFYWIPRVAGMAFIGFLSLFALDVFNEGTSLGAIVWGFLIHLIPSYLLVLVLAYAWKKEMSGGLMFIFIGVLFTLFFRINEVVSFMTISYPVFLIGALFLLHYYVFGDGAKQL